jgi:polyisoprenoid-binding protein YceI
MQAPPGQTASALPDLLAAGSLTGSWVLDPRKSSIRLTSGAMWGLARVNGVFREVSGTGTVRPGGHASGTITVAAASVDTKNSRRDAHLRSKDFFDSENIPDITFTADEIRSSGQGVAVTGALTVRGRTRLLDFTATAAIQGNGEVWIDAKVPINRADFGLSWNLLGTVSNRSAITVHAVFTRP